MENSIVRMIVVKDVGSESRQTVILKVVKPQSLVSFFVSVSVKTEQTGPKTLY